MAEFDYVIVGAGSAGCVLANRLSAAPDVRVLVVEAGGSDAAMNVRIPAAFAKLFRTERDWDHGYEPQPQTGDRRLYMPRGRMLGGSSSMNAMIYIRGNRADYDGWAAAGAKGWSFDEVLPYFLRAEHNERGASAYHGTGGPLDVADLRSPNPLSQRFVDAAPELGLPRNPDFNAQRQEGLGLYQVTQRRGRRWSAADAYLRPAMGRANLTVEIDALVTRVVTGAGRAQGVEYELGGRTVVARAVREVIVCAGAVGSPQLLMLSGIGPADHLRDHGLDVVVGNDHVGANLQDHPVAGMSWATSQRGTLAEAEKPASLLRYAATRTGLLTSNVGEAGGFLRTRDDLAAPDIQLHFAPGYFQDHGAATHDGGAVTIAPTLLTPRSRGRVRLRSPDPAAKPRLVGDVLTDREDVDALLAGMQVARDICGTRAFGEVVGAPLEPAVASATPAESEAWLRRKVELLYHPAGTVRMGDDEGSVVDPELRVHGIDGLRVVDASVMPTLVRGNTNAPTIMIAEKAADLIRGAVSAPSHSPPR